jgi:histidinol dehydrogenase
LTIHEPDGINTGRFTLIEISRYSFDNPRFKALLDRASEMPLEVIETVNRIIDDVKQRRDKALFEYTLMYDNTDLSETGPEVTDEEFEKAHEEVPKYYTEALKAACDNLLKYHQHQLTKPYTVEYPYGVTLERRVKPLERVGVCVPSGQAPLCSSLYMNIIPAIVAGVPEIYVIASPKRGTIDSTILYTADFLGIRKVYKISGAQGVAALAYGTETVPSVDKIVGPGNVYVQTAKRLLFGLVGIDSIAGPSEIAIIVGNEAPASFVAADLLSQAEHGTGLEASVAFCLSEEKAKEIRASLTELIAEHDMEESVSRALAAYGSIFIVDSIASAVEAVNILAPEHVEIMTRNSRKVSEKIVNAGAVFVGPYSPEPVGDYFCGTNHILPTGGTARFSSGLNVVDFMRSYSVVNYTEQALRANSTKIQSLARPEGMRAHILSVAVRSETGKERMRS